MHVLFLIHRYPPAAGGSALFVQERARRLAAERHRATVDTTGALEISSLWRRGSKRLPGSAGTTIAPAGSVDALASLMQALIDSPQSVTAAGEEIRPVRTIDEHVSDLLENYDWARRGSS